MGRPRKNADAQVSHQTNPDSVVLHLHGKDIVIPASESTKSYNKWHLDDDRKLIISVYERK